VTSGQNQLIRILALAVVATGNLDRAPRFVTSDEVEQTDEAETTLAISSVGTCE
jgi:hypothetical protein